MAGKIIGVLFLARDTAHREHLKTKSYAKHMALNDFYHEVIDMADTLAEAYQGRHGVIDDIPIVSIKGGKDIIDKLKTLMEMIEEERKEYKDDSPIQNIIDSIVGLFLSTLYKLENLK